MRRATSVFGDFVVSYVVVPVKENETRLVVKILMRRGVRSSLLAWGDLVMMRKQLLTMKRLAEEDARARGQG